MTADSQLAMRKVAFSTDHSGFRCFLYLALYCHARCTILVAAVYSAEYLAWENLETKMLSLRSIYPEDHISPEEATPRTLTALRRCGLSFRDITYRAPDEVALEMGARGLTPDEVAFIHDSREDARQQNVQTAKDEYANVLAGGLSEEEALLLRAAERGGDFALHDQDLPPSPSAGASLDRQSVEDAKQALLARHVADMERFARQQILAEDAKMRQVEEGENQAAIFAEHARVLEARDQGVAARLQAQESGRMQVLGHFADMQRDRQRAMDGVLRRSLADYADHKQERRREAAERELHTQEEAERRQNVFELAEARRASTQRLREQRYRACAQRRDEQVRWAALARTRWAQDSGVVTGDRQALADTGRELLHARTQELREHEYTERMARSAAATARARSEAFQRTAHARRRREQDIRRVLARWQETVAQEHAAKARRVREKDVAFSECRERLDADQRRRLLADEEAHRDRQARALMQLRRNQYYREQLRAAAALRDAQASRSRQAQRDAQADMAGFSRALQNARSDVLSRGIVLSDGTLDIPESVRALAREDSVLRCRTLGEAVHHVRASSAGSTGSAGYAPRSMTYTDKRLLQSHGRLPQSPAQRSPYTAASFRRRRYDPASPYAASVQHAGSTRLARTRLADSPAGGTQDTCGDERLRSLTPQTAVARSARSSPGTGSGTVRLRDIPASRERVTAAQECAMLQARRDAVAEVVQQLSRRSRSSAVTGGSAARLHNGAAQGSRPGTEGGRRTRHPASEGRVRSSSASQHSVLVRVERSPVPRMELPLYRGMPLPRDGDSSSPVFAGPCADDKSPAQPLSAIRHLPDALSNRIASLYGEEAPGRSPTYYAAKHGPEQTKGYGAGEFGGLEAFQLKGV